MDSRRAQGAFEYVLMLSGVLLVVITMVFLMQGTTSSANNAVGNTMKTASTLVDPSYYIPGAKPIFIPPTPADGSWGTGQPNVAAVIAVTNAKLSTLTYGWNGVNTSFYDPSLVLSMSLDDNPSIGETSSKAVDVSQYGNNGTIYDNTLLLVHADENSGSKTYDESQFALTGTCYAGTSETSCARSAGVSGNALDFDGSGSSRSAYFSGPNLNINGSFTLETWIKLKSAPSGTIYAATGGATDNPGGGKYALWFSSSQVAQFCVQQPTAWTKECANSPAIPLNQWHHIVGVWDRNANTVSIYYDGVFQASNPTDIQYLASSNALVVGALSQGYYWLNGSLDEIGIYNRTLSPAEIQQHFAAGKAKHDSWTPNGKWNSAMKFDGANDYVNAGNSASLNFTSQEFTLLLWASQTYHDSSAIIQKGNNGFDANNNKGFALIPAGSPSKLYGLIGNGTSHVEIYSNLDTFGWTQLGLERLANGTVYMIINGTVNYGGTLVGDINSAYPLMIGRSNYYSGFLNGSVDEVRIWNRALSGQEIAMQYASNLYKYDNSTWYFNNNNANLSVGAYSYALYANAGRGKDLMSDLRTVHVCSVPLLPC